MAAAAPIPAPGPLSTETIQAHTSIAERFLATWSAGLTLPTADFLAPYAADVVWLDHFFRLHLVGPAAVEQLRQRWLGAHDNYSIETVAIQATASGAVAQVINKGVFARDMLPKRKASGKTFACHACYILRVDSQGRISRVDEYQPMDFDDGCEIDGYILRDGTAVVKG